MQREKFTWVREYEQKEWNRKTPLIMEHIKYIKVKCTELHRVTQSFEFAGSYLRVIVGLPYMYNGVSNLVYRGLEKNS
jgi:hypothetical protein